MNKNILVGGLTVVALVFGVLYVATPVKVDVNVPEVQVGAISGPDIYFPIKIHDTLTWQMPILATSTSGTATTLKFSDMDRNGMIDLMSNVAAFTYTLPATSTMLQFLPNDGDTRTWIFHNATSTATATLTIAKGTGIFLIGPSANDDVIDNDEYATLTCTNVYYRSALNADITCVVNELTDVD